MKKIFLMGIFMLSGCIYEQPPAPINSVDVVEPIQKVQQPTSYSYPLPEPPRSINSVIINEPQPIQNESSQSNEIVIDNSQQDTNSANNVPDNNSTNIVDQVISDATSAKPVVNSAPVGSFNNPIRFDQSKVY